MKITLLPIPNLERKRSLGRLSGQHHAVRAVQYRVRHIAALRPRRPRLLDHALQHLRGTDDRLARTVAPADHHLLGEEDLLGGDLYPQVPASDHDAV